VIGVLVSGSGSNLQALLDAGLPISAVASNRKDAYALVRACGAGVPTAAFSLDCHVDARRDLVMATGSGRGVRLVVLAGLHTPADQAVPQSFSGRIVNPHPSLFRRSQDAPSRMRWRRDGKNRVTIRLVGGAWTRNRAPPGTVRSIETLEEHSAVEHRLLPAVGPRNPPNEL
jgi:hypothetical protein